MPEFISTEKRSWYKLEQAYLWTEFSLRDGKDWSDTTIRCVMNDTLDRAHKTGCCVYFGYNQKKACARVRALHRKWLLSR
jgi:hypothetical protein